MDDFVKPKAQSKNEVKGGSTLLIMETLCQEQFKLAEKSPLRAEVIEIAHHEAKVFNDIRRLNFTALEQNNNIINRYLDKLGETKLTSGLQATYQEQFKPIVKEIDLLKNNFSEFKHKFTGFAEQLRTQIRAKIADYKAGKRSEEQTIIDLKPYTQEMNTIAKEATRHEFEQQAMIPRQLAVLRGAKVAAIQSGFAVNVADVIKTIKNA